MTLEDHVVRGRLAEAGDQMAWPIHSETGDSARVLATYHVPQGEAHTDAVRHLTYLALPANTPVVITPDAAPVPFAGDPARSRTVRLSPFQIVTDGFSLVKLHPGTGFEINGMQGQPYHSFELIGEPTQSGRYVDFVRVDTGNPRDEAYLAERMSKILPFPGGVLFPDYAAFRLPGWIAKEFNGSPEFGFALSEFSGPRAGEVLHRHTQIMEPYVGTGGELPLFVAHPDGEERLSVVHDGKAREYRGDIVPIRKGDVVIPRTGVPHRIQFDGAQFPFSMYCINYGPGLLTDAPKDDRVVLESG